MRVVVGSAVHNPDLVGSVSPGVWLSTQEVLNHDLAINAVPMSRLCTPSTDTPASQPAAMVGAGARSYGPLGPCAQYASRVAPYPGIPAAAISRAFSAA